MSRLSIWVEATRPKTLPAAACPVAVGSALAFGANGFFWVPALLCLCFALLVQIGTNFANDYLDGVKGSDTDARLGPQRAVATGAIPGPTMKRAALAVLALAFVLGLALIPFGGWWLLLVGVSSVLCAWAYTGGPLPLAYNGLGDIFVVVFFGFVAVGCTYFVQVGEWAPALFPAGLACGLLINNILVVNNFRDYEEDRRSAKNTLIVRFGRAFGRAQYLGSLFVVALVTVWFAWQGFGADVLLALLTLIPGWRVGWGLFRLASSADYLGALKQSGLVVAVYGLVFSGTLVW